jgi:hypothetical protein
MEYLTSITSGDSTKFTEEVSGKLYNNENWISWISSQKDIEIGDVVFYHTTGDTVSEYSHAAVVTGFVERDGIIIPEITDSNAYAGAERTRPIDDTYGSGSIDKVLIIRIRIY